MSSSKIQEYNLDPNMGLAKEETAHEILEKLDGVESNVGKDKWCGAFKLAQGSAKKSITATVLDVTGSGRLYALMGSTPHTSTKVIVNLTIDGTTYTITTIGMSGMTNLNGFLLCPPEFIVNEYGCVPLLSNGFTNSGGGFTKIETLKTATYSDEAIPKIFIPIENFIEFKQSLKVTVSHGSDSSYDAYARVLYMLSE